ncbi:MAG: tetratricopeptide repeat protein [Pyrinomonadaceae bacterium]|nr:tetratricopeptide repeat protein [Pyrinomonadaceae bacterium]
MFKLWISARIFSSLLLALLAVGSTASQSFNETTASRTTASIPRIAASSPPAVRKQIIGSYRAAVLKLPGDPVLHNNLGVELAMSSEFASAASSLENAVKLDPNSAPFLINLGLVYSNLGRNTEAWAVFERAVAIEPGNVRARTALCDQIAGGADPRGAIACYTELKKHTELDPVSSYNFANAIDAAGDAARAIGILEAAAVKYRNSAWIYNGLGMIRFREKDHKGAAEAFKSAVEIDPARAELRLNLAIVQLAMQNRAGALSQYNMLKTSNPKMAQELYRILFRDKVVYVGEAH